MDIAKKAKGAFIERFGIEPKVVAVAPGRINLIGEHTDYNDGFVFPVAIDRGIAVAASPTDGRSEMISLEAGEGAPYDTADLSPGTPTGWTVYPAGMSWALGRSLEKRMPNLRAVVHGDLPFASGVSSSAAIEVAFGTCLLALTGADMPAQRLAKIAQECEVEFVGVNCGIMDMTASACGREGHAMLLDTRSLAIRYVPVPDDLSIVLCDTATPRALSASAYNERRSQCETAASALGVPSLRDADGAMLEGARARLDPTVFRRAKHVIGENARCLAYVDALTSGDRTSLGRLMTESHDSLRVDYEVSSFELDRMVEAALASPGCIGARMTGAGFGGACVALVETGSLGAFVSSVEDGYRSRAKCEGRFMACRASAGAHTV